MKFNQFFKQTLNEAPIADFQRIGEWGDNDKKRGYDKASIGILKSEKGVEKIKKLWNKTEQDFDIYVVRTKEGWKYTEVGEVDFAFIRDKLKLDVPIDGDHITVFYTNNKGSEKVPMTAWTMAHRFGHTLRRGNPEYNLLDKLVDAMLSEIASKVYGRDIKSQYSYSYDRNNNYKDKELIKKELGHALGVFKSARDRNLRNSAEFTNELVAQYIITGKIVFNKEFPRVLPTRFNWGRPDGPWNRLKEEDKEEIMDYIEKMENTFEYQINDRI